jgi:hypothetical protein
MIIRLFEGFEDLLFTAASTTSQSYRTRKGNEGKNEGVTMGNIKPYVVSGFCTEKERIATFKNEKRRRME